MAMFQTLKLLPSHILGIEGELVGVLGFGLIGAVLVLIPFLDRAAIGQRSRLPVVFGIGLIAYSILLTYLGYTMSPTK
jgi:quinol-cytochrome oxidoreductase complex cytochrome b subunit